MFYLLEQFLKWFKPLLLFFHIPKLSTRIKITFITDVIYFRNVSRIIFWQILQKYDDEERIDLAQAGAQLRGVINTAINVRVLSNAGNSGL